jgi:hypothetical protein
MGKLRKIGKKIGRGIKKLGKAVGKGFKKVFGAFGDMGPLGSIALWFLMPQVASTWNGWMDTLMTKGAATNASTAMKFAGSMAEKAVAVTDTVGGLYNNVTDAIGGTIDTITEPLLGEGQGLASRFESFANSTRKSMGLEPDASFAAEQEKIIQEGQKGIKMDKAIEFQDKKPFWQNDAGKFSWKEAAGEAAITTGIGIGGQMILQNYIPEPDLGGAGYLAGAPLEEAPAVRAQIDRFKLADSNVNSLADIYRMPLVGPGTNEMQFLYPKMG